MSKSTLFSRIDRMRGHNARWFWVVCFASMGWASGWVPSFSQHTASLSFASTAVAQTASQISNYAEAVLQMEAPRKRYYNEVRSYYQDQSLPNDVCRQSNLPNRVQGLCDQFFSDSADILRRNNLSIREFNQLTEQIQRDSDLRDRVQQELIRRQQQRR
ncbi:DUF4168 domain-containing protein [Synechococcales cyanobacterium C]|uniref:DUF4168 domain-containing protein n=1 Tax=Petrachloros mirabilis ULC683 TaxID=2781853 RepID=A0A8K2A2P5_9CYAN|nr:DUF4168 domain-containing protein [Petrachloros mirabilis]NCJ08497.1 DUF4168 domain-containing protein [Petrachloros mirabilis ULC683]